RICLSLPVRHTLLLPFLLTASKLSSKIFFILSQEDKVDSKTGFKRSSISNATTLFAFNASCSVSEPIPGLISITFELESIPAESIIRDNILPSIKKFCTRLFLIEYRCLFIIDLVLDGVAIYLFIFISFYYFN